MSKIDKSAGQLHEAASAMARHSEAIAAGEARLTEERAQLAKQSERYYLALSSLRAALSGEPAHEPAVKAETPKRAPRSKGGA